MAVPLHGETRHSALRADELRAYPFSRVTLRHSLRVQEGGTTARIRNAAVMLPQDNSVKGASRPCWPWLKLRVRLCCGRPCTRPAEQFQSKNAPGCPSGRPRLMFPQVRRRTQGQHALQAVPCPASHKNVTMSGWRKYAPGRGTRQNPRS